MPFAAGYLVDLSGVTFDEATMSSWIQAMPYGDYNHPMHGKISLNQERANNFAKNFAENARGQELDIDYDHKAKTDEAAGWVKKVEARSDGLYYFVEWTKDAYTKIKNKAYKYFSPEFHDEWTNPANGKTFKDVLFGGGLTNRPFLKGILPINLSELELAPTKPEEGSTSMTPEQIKKYATKFGLGEDATEEAVFAAIDAAELAKADPPKDNEIPEDVQTAIAAAEKALADAKKLSETNPNLAPMVALMEIQAGTLAAQGKQLAEQSAALKLTEVDNTVKSLNEKANGAGFALPIPLRDKIKSELLNAPKQFSESLGTTLSEILDAKLVALGEKGKLRVIGGQQTEGTPIEELDKRVKALRENDKTLSLTEATTQVFDADPEFYDEYRKGSYANAGEN